MITARTNKAVELATPMMISSEAGWEVKILLAINMGSGMELRNINGLCKGVKNSFALLVLTMLFNS